MSRKRRRGTSPFSLFAFQDIITATTGIVVLLLLMMTLELLTRSSRAESAVDQELVKQAQQTLDNARARISDLRSQLSAVQQPLNVLASADAEELDRRERRLAREKELLEHSLAELTRTEKRVVAAHQQALAEQFDRKGDFQRLDDLRSEVESIKEKMDGLRRENRLIYNQSPGTSRTAWIIDVGGSRLLVAQAGETPTVHQTMSGSEAMILTEFRKFTDRLSPTSDYLVFLVRPSGIDLFFQLRDEVELNDVTFGFDLIGEEHTVIGAAEQVD